MSHFLYANCLQIMYMNTIMFIPINQSKYAITLIGKSYILIRAEIKKNRQNNLKNYRSFCIQFEQSCKSCPQSLVPVWPRGCWWVACLVGWYTKIITFLTMAMVHCSQIIRKCLQFIILHAKAQWSSAPITLFKDNLLGCHQNMLQREKLVWNNLHLPTYTLT